MFLNYKHKYSAFVMNALVTPNKQNHFFHFSHAHTHTGLVTENFPHSPSNLMVNVTMLNDIKNICSTI